MRKPYIPKGCDQQGRYPQAADAVTEIGFEDEEAPFDWRAMLSDIAISVALVGTIALLVFLGGAVR